MAVLVLVFATLAGGLPCLAGAQPPEDAEPNTRDIRVVNLTLIFREYISAKPEYQSLLEEVEEAREEVQELGQDLRARGESLQAEAEQLSEEEREVREAELESKILEYRGQAELTKGELDVQERALLNESMDEIMAAVRAVADEEGYDLVMEAGSEAAASVVYYATPVDITTQVLKKLRSQAAQ